MQSLKYPSSVLPINSFSGYNNNQQKKLKSFLFSSKVGPLSLSRKSLKVTYTCLIKNVMHEPAVIDPERESNVEENIYVVGCGGVGVDYLASVQSFPQPDDKIRSLDLQIQGGGNVGNCLTGVARLGLKPIILTNVADDSLGKQIMAELEAEGIDSSHVIVTKGGVSPFTYIIVDRKTHTRTCIHTPKDPPLSIQEIQSQLHLNSIFEKVKLAYFDVRLVDMAIPVLREAVKRSIPVLVDAERPREGLDLLITEADYVVCSSNFPLVWSGQTKLSDAILIMATKLKKIKFFIITMGSSGSIMFEKHEEEEEEKKKKKEKESNDKDMESDDIDNVLNNLQSLNSNSNSNDQLHPVVRSSPILKFCGEINGEKLSIFGKLYVCSSLRIPKAEIVDTTGAGDAFISGIIYGICTEMTYEQMLILASVVAGTKCKSIGARKGLPFKKDVQISSLIK